MFNFKTSLIIGILVAVVAFIVLIFNFDSLHDGWELLTTPLVLGGLAFMGAFFGIGDESPEPANKTKMVSCRKCGYYGAKGSNGFCPRCRSANTVLITDSTKIVSCLKCGYYGAKDSNGLCPRCRSANIRDVK